jgi:hypothetical protein
LTAPLRIAVIGGGIGGLAAAVSLLRVEFDVDVYEKAPQLNEVSGDIRGGVPWRRAREIVAEPMVCGLTAGGSRIRTLGPAEDLQRPWPASVPVRGRLFLVTGKSGRGDFRGLEDLGRVTRDREFEAGFLRLASLLETKLHSSRSIGQVARQWAEN